MEESLERLKTKRRTLRAMTTKLMKRIEDVIRDRPEDTETLDECLTNLKRKEESLTILDENIGKAINDDELENELVTTEEYKEKVISWISKLERQQKKVQDQQYSSSGARNESGKHTSVSIKLPRLSISNFNGNSGEWQNFWAQYSAAIHDNNNLRKTEKFSYLKSFLTSAALNAVSGLSLTDENYDVAVKLLTDRFGRKDLVIGAHMNTLLNLTPVKRSNDVLALRKLYDQLEIQIRCLETMGIISDAYSSLLCPILLKSIPEDIALQFNRERELDSEWDAQELLKLMKREVESRERTQLLMNYNNENITVSSKGKAPLSSKFDSHKSSKKYPVNNPTAVALKTITETRCLFCNETTHLSYECKMPVENKKSVLLKQGRCFVCFKKRHLARRCWNKNSCQICNQRHHTSLYQGVEPGLAIFLRSEDLEKFLSIDISLSPNCYMAFDDLTQQRYSDHK